MLIVNDADDCNRQRIMLGGSFHGRCIVVMVDDAD